MSIITSLERVGIKPPPAVVAAFGMRTAVGEYCMGSDRTEFDIGGQISTAELTAATIVKAIQVAAAARVTRTAALQIHRDLTRWYVEGERRAVREAGDEIVRLMRPIVAAALERLAAAVEVVGAVPNAKVGNVGPGVHRALAELSAGIATMQDAGSVIADLVEANYYADVKPSEIAIWLDPATTGADVGHARVIVARCEGNRYASLIAAGAKLTVNDAATVRALLAAEAEVANRPAAVVPLTSRQQALAKAWSTPVPA